MKESFDFSNLTRKSYAHHLKWMALKKLFPNKYNQKLKLYNKQIFTVFGWNDLKGSLRSFYNLLVKHKFISSNCTWKNFKAHFIKGKIVPPRIQCLKDIGEFVYIFSCLCGVNEEEQIIPIREKIHMRLREHILNKDGDVPTPGVLSSSLYKITIRKKSRESLDEIVRAVKINPVEHSSYQP